MYFAAKTKFNDFLTTQNLCVRFMEVYIFSGSKETVRFNQVFALQLAFPHLDMDKKEQRYRHEVFHIQVWTHLRIILVYPYPSVEAHLLSDMFSGELVKQQ